MATVLTPARLLAPGPHEAAVCTEFLAAWNGDRSGQPYREALASFVDMLRWREGRKPLVCGGKVWWLTAGGELAWETAAGGTRGRKPKAPDVGGRTVRWHGPRLPGLDERDAWGATA